VGFVRGWGVDRKKPPPYFAVGGGKDLRPGRTSGSPGLAAAARRADRAHEPCHQSTIRQAAIHRRVCRASPCHARGGRGFRGATEILQGPWSVRLDVVGPWTRPCPSAISMAGELRVVHAERKKTPTSRPPAVGRWQNRLLPAISLAGPFRYGPASSIFPGDRRDRYRGRRGGSETRQRERRFSWAPNAEAAPAARRPHGGCGNELDHGF